MKKYNATFQINRLDWLLALLLGGLSLGIYIHTLAPGVLPGDSGEFQVLAYQLGIAHCPGYPVYLFLAKIFTFLPVGDIAYRVNMFSAFMAALTVSGIYLTAHIITCSRSASTFAAFVVLFSYTFWSQALIAEVYTAGAAFTIAILFSVLLWGKTGKTGLLFAAGLLGGLSLGVHTTIAVLAPGILVFLFLHRRDHPGFWIPAIAGVFLGLILWVTLFFIVDHNAPPANIFNAAYETARSKWDLTAEDIENPWVRIWFIASARQWRSALNFNLSGMAKQAGSYFWNLPREFSYFTILLILIGLVGLSRNHGKTSVLLWLSLLSHWLISFNYRIGDIYVFYITGYLILALASAAGITLLFAWIQKIIPDLWGFLPGVITLIVAIIALSMMVIPRLPALKTGTIPFIGEPGYLLQEDPTPLAKAAYRTVEKMKPGSIVFVDWGSLYIYYYVAHIEQGRTDLRFIEPSPRADRPGLPHSVITFIEENIDSHLIYFSHPFPEVEAAGLQFRRVLIYYTTFYQVVRP